MAFQIAIDGPAGSGKSTVAKALAAKLGFIHIDTGAMYRSIALYVHNNNIDAENENAVLSCLPHIDIKLEYINGKQKTILNGIDVSLDIRTAEIGELASKVAKYGALRRHLVSMQQTMAENKNVVMDGRDITTVVLKNADVKVYLDASIEVRAQRRVEELEKLGKNPDFNTIANQIKKRDFDDKNHAESSFRVAVDAYYIDTSNKVMDEVIDDIMKLVGVQFV